MDFLTNIILFIIVLIGYWIQSISGFGAIIFALPLSMFFIDRALFLPVALFMSVIQSLAVAYKDRHYIDKKKFLVMLGLAGLGLPIGIIITGIFDEVLMNYILGCFIIMNSGYSLYVEVTDKLKNIEMKPHHYVYPFLSGLLQTAYGVGGPLIGTYMDKQTEEKREYRAMISLYWCILNPFIIMGYFLKGNINSNHPKLFILLFPAVILGYILGNLTVDKISQKKFKQLTHIMLICIGFTLFF